MRTLAFALLVPLLAGCAVPPPTQEEAEEALGKMHDDAENQMFLRLLEAAEAKSAKDAEAAVPSASSAASAEPPKRLSAGTPRALRNATIESRKCDQVDRKSHDCNVTWRPRGVRTPKQGVYRFTRAADQTWTARPR